MNAVLNPGRTGRDTGMARSSAHADDCHADWSSMAYFALRNFARKFDGNFTAEHARAWMHSQGLPMPPDGRAFGSVFQRVAREGIIRKLGYRQAEGRACHMHPVTLWKVVE